jgi:outer membrane protease
MKKLFFQIHTIVFIAFSSISAFGQDAVTKSEQDVLPESKQIKAFKFSAESGPEAYFGYTLYQIGGIIEEPDGSKYRTWFPLSELKFPLNVHMVSGDIKFEIFEKYIIHTNIKKNITSKAGKMKDSDWGVFSNNPSSLEIYSESDAKLDAFVINSDFQVRTFTTSIFSLLAGAGFLYQKFNYDISNVNQTSVNPMYQGYVHGEVLTYKIDYYIPYAVVTPCININNKIIIMQSIAISQYVIAKDVDDHLLRYKKSKGDAKGSAFITSLKTEFHYIPVVFFNLTLNYIYITADGYQKQYQYKEYFDGSTTIPVGPIGKIQNKIKSSQFSAGINAGMRF